MQGNTSRDMKKNIKKDASNKSVTHPCKYCAKPCFGLQCKECHLKMVENLMGDCSDCGEKFRKILKDGTVIKKCFPCHETYMKTYIGTCKCGETYKKLLEDGRKFDKCFSCYQASRKKCEKCDSFTFKDNSLCSECYHSSRKCATEKCDNMIFKSNKLCSDCYKKERSSEDVFNCRKKSCTRKTSRENGYCRECFRDNRNTSMQYMISTCSHVDCSERYKGSFKFCEAHSTAV